MNYYWAFGLRLKSHISFPELVSLDEVNQRGVQVTIELGTCPRSLQGDNVIKKFRNWSRPNEILIFIRGVCWIHARNGDSIVVEPCSPEPEWDAIRVFVLSSALAAVLHQRGWIPLHASAIRYQEGVVLLMGISGAGKSTAVSLLDQTGYPIFSDDICVIKNVNRTGQDFVTSSYPMTRHLDDTIDLLNDDDRYNRANPVRKPLKKYGNFFHDKFVTKELPLIGVIQLEIHNTMAVESMAISSFSQRVLSLYHHVYRKGHLEGMGGRKDVFLKLTTLAQKHPVVRVKRPIGQEFTEAFINTIKSEIELFTATT